MKYLKHLLISATFVFCIAKNSKACGPSPSEFYPYFHPNIVANGNLEKFWFDPGHELNQRLGVLNAGDDMLDSFSALVLNDWMAFSSNKFEPKELHETLFDRKARPEESEFVKWLYKQKGGEAYYGLMHECTQFTGELNQWNEVVWVHPNNLQYGQRSHNPQLLKLTLDKIEKLKKSRLHKFIKHRLNYLEIRLAYYAGNDDLVSQIFNQYFEKRDKDWLYYSAKYYYAMSLDGKKSYTTLLDMVRKSRDKQGRIIELLYYNIDAFDSATVSTLPPSSKNDLLAIKIMHNPSDAGSELRALIMNEPENPFIPMLLAREINKTEEYYHNTYTYNWYSWFWDYSYSDYSENEYPVYRRFTDMSAQRIKMRSKTMATYKVAKMAYQTYPLQSFKLMLAYAEIFVDETESSLKKLDEILTQPQSELIKTQTEQIKLIALGYKGDWKNPYLKEGIVKVMKGEYPSYRDYYDTKYQTLSHLALLSAAEGKYTLSYFLYEDWHDGDILNFAPDLAVYDNIIKEIELPSSRFIKDLIKLSNKGGKSGIEAVKRAKAQWLMRNNYYTEAVDLFKSITDPVTDSTRQLFLVNYEGRNTYMDDYYWKYQNTHKVLDQFLFYVEKSKEPGPNQAKYELLVGNALLSMCNNGDNSELGNNMRFYYAPEYKTEPSVMRFFNGQLAEPWFKKAFEHCNDPKLGALITIQWGATAPEYSKDPWGGQDKSHPKDFSNPKYKLYKAKFPHSDYFDEYSFDCDNIRMYYSRLNKEFGIN